MLLAYRVAVGLCSLLFIQSVAAKDAVDCRANHQACVWHQDPATRFHHDQPQFRSLPRPDLPPWQTSQRSSR